MRTASPFSTQTCVSSRLASTPACVPSRRRLQGADPCLVPVDPATCVVQPAYASCTGEVDFGRISEARSPDTVFDSQLEDVVVNLATADCVTLDPAGRLVTSRVVDGVVTTGEIDSPLQNLAMYKQLMQNGFLGAGSARFRCRAERCRPRHGHWAPGRTRQEQ